MATPITISIPHQLGRAEARRRIEAGFSKSIGQLPGNARNQPSADLRLPEEGVLAACEADVASHREFVAVASHPAPDDRDADNAAGSQALRRLDKVSVFPL